jgi:hypothetical protein
MIAGAKKTLDISNAYFVPSSPFVDMLLAAHERGVRVRVLMPGPYHDEPAVRRASRRRWPPLLKAGIELYEHQKTMMHSKVIVVDELVTGARGVRGRPVEREARDGHGSETAKHEGSRAGRSLLLSADAA